MVPSIFKTGWHVSITVLVFCTLLGAQQASAQQTFYSRNATAGAGNANWDANTTWSNTGHGGAVPCGGCQQTPGPDDDVIIAANHTVIYRSGNQPAASLRSVLNLTVNGTLQFGNNNNTIAFSVLNDVTVGTGGTIRNGATGTNTHTFNIGGDLENNGTFDFGTVPVAANLTVSTTVAFTGSGQTITGTGSLIQLYRMTNSGGNVSTTQPLRINGTLNFASDGLLSVLAPANITLTAAATIPIYSANRYIELDGKATSTSQLIRENSGSVNQWRIFYPVGTPTGGYTPLDLSAAGVVAGGTPTSGSTLSIKPIFNTSIQGQLRRTFRLLVSGNNAATTLNAGARFYYNELDDISGGDVEANYDTNWFLNAGNGSWTSLTGGTVMAADNYFTGAAGQPLRTGTYYYTIGTANAYPMTWYSYQTGFWKNWENWTQDPSGTTLVNPLNLPPQPGDQVVILNGFTITADTSNIVLGSTTIQGGAVLDMTTMTDNTLGTVSGAGLLRIGSVNLPAGTYTNFVAAGTGGTVEYYNTGGALSTTQTVYNKLWLTNSTNAAITFVSGSDLTVNSDFNITQTGSSGTVTWQINNGSTTRRTIVLSGNLTVSANGRIRTSTGTPTAAHQMTITGNIVNNGSIKLFDDTDTQLTDAAYTAGTIYGRNLKRNVVEVTVTGLSDNSFTLHGQTDFYRLVVNKGTGQQAMLTINSSNVANFRLFGPTNQNYSGAAPNYISDNALSLINGTLQLQGTITIPNLVINGGGGIGGGWPIPQNAALWVNGDNIDIQVTNTTDTGDNGRQIYVFGLLRLTKGTMNLGFSRGLLGGGSGVFQMEGGTLNTWQIRTTYLGANNRFAYKQTGGSVNVGTAGQVGPSFHEYPRFALPYQECTFEMSGGNLTVATPTDANGQTRNGGMLIYAATSNIKVTGGNVYAQLPASNVNFTICSTAPFYNLDISKTSTAGTSGAVLSSLIFDDGTAYTRPAQPLTVLNDLTISGGDALLDCNSLDLTVGGNFQIATGTTYRPDDNTTTFNGTGAQAWTQSGTIANLYRVVMQKTAGTLTLGGSGTFPNITSSLELTAGTLADNTKTLTVTGTLSNSAVHASTGAGTGAIVLNNAASNTIGGANGTFGNLTIQTGAVVYTAGKQTVTNTLRLVTANTTLNIGSYNLTVLGTIVPSAGFGNNCNIETSGLQNAGGLTRKATSAADILFPVGTSTVLYTPVTINATATTAGTITVRPVKGAHPNVTTIGQSVQFYWRVTSDGFAGLGAVSHKTYTYSTAARDNAGAGYRAARYDPVTYSWSYSNAAYASNAVPGTTTIAVGASPHEFNTGTPGAWVNSAGSMLDGEYTAGNMAAFQTVTVYYSRLNGAWNANTTWSTNPDRVAAATGTPCLTCPVVIGSADGSLAHTVTITDANKSCGSLELNLNAFLDCGTITGHNFGTNVGGGTVAGRGTLRIGSAVFPAGDFINFLGPDGGTVEWYGTTKTLPATGPGPQNLNLLNYYNLILNPYPANTIYLSANDMLVYNNLTKTGTGNIYIDDTGNRKLVINNNFDIVEGAFSLRTGAVADMYVGNITIGPDGLFNMSGATAQVHNITVTGSIVNNGRLYLRSTSHVANLLFTGESNASLTGTGEDGTILNVVTVDKGTSQTPVLMFDLGGTVQTLGTNWLNLVNGTFAFNNENTYTISTNTTPYNIPSTARLKIDKGVVNIIGNVTNNAGDLTLAGTLEVTGGSVNINAAANNRTVNNDIEYAAAGTPTIIVSGGDLYVNGSIRRPTTTLSGALVYNQSGGTVTVGGRNAAGVNTRGVFEIENNPGSSFTMTGGTLSVSRSTAGTAYADLYINPVTSHVLPNATIEIGTSTTSAVSTTLSLNIVPTIGNLSILGTTTKQTVNIRSSKLNLSGTLQINNNTELETNTLDVTIGGDLSILGTGIYDGTIGGGNTTTFNGSGAQTGDLTATSTFQNITIDKGAGVATLTGTTSINNLNILRGVLSVSGTLNVNGNIVNNSTQVGNGFIMMSGTATTHTITSGGGSFTNLSLGGTALTKTVDVVGNTTINGTLDFTTSGTYRYLNIASNQWVFGSQNNPVSNAGTNRFIRTNGVSSDLGVVRNWSTGTNTFTYPVGTRTNYTPATYTLNVSTPGRLTVIAVNEQHPTASANGQYILNYYWMVQRDNSLVYGNNGTHTYQFPSGVVGGGSGTFMGAHLDAINLIGWTRPVGALNAAAADPRILTITNGLTFDASPSVPANMPQPGGEYHYTAGTTQTLPNPVQPVYTRYSDVGGGNATTAKSVTGANWNLATNWTLSSTGYGLPLSTVPVGRPVVILDEARMNMNTSGQRAFSTRIDGLLYTGSLSTPTVGHNLGAISGTGTLRTATNTLPAGNYTQFVSAGGGTIEYIAPMTMNNRNTYNHVSVIGSGVLTMTNTDLILNGNMTIGTGTTLDNSTNNRDITIAGNWTNNSTFNTGTGAVIFTGNNTQTVNGSTAFYNMVLSKSGGRVVLNGTGTTTVNNAFTLTTGYMITSATNPLIFAPAATWTGAGEQSFVSGPMRRNVPAGGSFQFPSGGFNTLAPINRYRPVRLSSTSAADTWTGQYIAGSPTTDGFNSATFNTVNLGDVSVHEYWLVSRSGSAAANLTLSYDVGSYKPPTIGVLANLRVVRWTGSQWDFPPGATSFVQDGSTAAGTVTVSTVTNFSPFTFGSTDQFTPLPLKWIDFTAQRAGTGIALDWITEKERNASHFEVERSEDGRTYTQIGTVEAVNSESKNKYDFFDKKANMQTRYYYRIRQVDLDQQSSYSNVLSVLEITGEQNAKARWAVTPNPIVDQVIFWQQDEISNGQLQAVLTTATGVQVFVGAGTLQTLNERIERVMNTAGAGVYILQLSDGNYQEKFRLVHL
ncbi:hypothetical protein KK062_00025 [Fulvivirgaceae bacterium PWU5]|uniref:Uncharacterized protein n=1 Tax=Dawidia cretensis TaxID=2782350 RepID=A0AAP2DUU3_9BACT|nr:G8 domain-containing protein [Dawidia cretensis]MBT1706582.1 hypothetical protein [Dawidia cretensis]